MNLALHQILIGRSSEDRRSLESPGGQEFGRLNNVCQLALYEWLAQQVKPASDTHRQSMSTTGEHWLLSPAQVLPDVLSTAPLLQRDPPSLLTVPPEA